jgi:hypothetical protein
MIIDDLYRDSVGYLVSAGADGKRYPIATVFFVRLGLTNHCSASYAVTCRHGIEPDPAYRGLFLRLNQTDKKWQDHEVARDKWVCHSSADVAVCPLEFSHVMRELPVSVFLAQQQEKHLFAGQEVFLVGLFTESAHEARIESVVRFGHISKPRTRCKFIVDIKKKKSIEADAHLVECLSWGGESGSPVFINDASLQSPHDPFYETPPEGLGYGIPPAVYVARHLRPPIIGMFHGHYPIARQIGTPGTQSSSVLQLSSGIGIVIPARAILETLMTPQLEADRGRMKAICERDHFRPKTSRR